MRIHAIVRLGKRIFFTQNQPFFSPIRPIPVLEERLFLQRLGTSGKQSLSNSSTQKITAVFVVVEPEADRGPVLITVEYRIDPASAEDFARAMRDVRRTRLRDGAFRWDLLSDPADPGRYVESFMVESWVEHLRQHERVTVSDREVEERARRHHRGPGPPVVSHFIAKDLPR